MKPIRIYLLLVILLVCSTTLFISCKRSCRFIKLPKIKAPENYLLVDGTVSYKGSYISGTPQTIINSDSIYKLWSKYLPFGAVDINKHTIVALAISTKDGKDVAYQSFLCIANSGNAYLYKVQYSLDGQCLGSGIYPQEFTAWLLCPKIPANATIDFQEEDINPH